MYCLQLVTQHTRKKRYGPTKSVRNLGSIASMGQKTGTEINCKTDDSGSARQPLTTSIEYVMKNLIILLDSSSSSSFCLPWTRWSKINATTTPSQKVK